MKRLLSFLLVIFIFFGLVGCNKANDTDSSGLSSIGKPTETSSVESVTESAKDNIPTEESQINTEDKINNPSKTNKEEIKTNPSNNNPTNKVTSSTNSINSNNSSLSVTSKTEENTFTTESDSVSEETKIYCVPNFIGKLIYEIDIPGSNLYDCFEHFTINTQSKDNYEYPNGYILAQSINAGTNVKEKTEITLFVSRREERRLPYVCGLGKDKAIEELKKCGFEIETIEKYDSDSMPNTVLQTEPTYGDLVPIGATITLYINSFIE